MTERAILFILGLEGHLHHAKAVAEEFASPVAGITLSQQMTRMVQETDVCRPDRLYAFPDFHAAQAAAVERLSLAEIRADIDRLARAWRIASIATYIAMDRYFRAGTDYAATMRMALLFMRFAEEILAREDPLWVKGNMTTFFGLVLRDACLAGGIASLKHQTARVAGRVEFSDETFNGGLRGWRPIYEALARGEPAVAPEVAAEARAWLATFLGRPERPGYAKRNARTEFDAGRLTRTLRHAVGLRFKRRYWSEFADSALDRTLGYRPPPGRAFLIETLGVEAKGILERRAGWYRREVDLEEPFVYLPLQFWPEITTLTLAIRYEDPLHVVRELAKAMPNGWRLYVKDHTSMVGRRPLGFQRRLQEQHNITLVSPRVSTFDLMRKAKAIATLTSTAGWEGFLLGRPVLVLGDAFYREFPNVAPIAFTSTTAAEIAAYVEGFEPDPQAIERAVIAYFGATYAGRTGDIGVDCTAGEAPAYAVGFAKACRRQLEEFPLARLAALRGISIGQPRGRDR